MILRTNPSDHMVRGDAHISATTAVAEFDGRLCFVFPKFCDQPGFSQPCFPTDTDDLGFFFSLGARQGFI